MQFTKETLKLLEKEYYKAKENKDEVFEFMGKEFFVPYTKHLIEYLRNKFK